VYGPDTKVTDRPGSGIWVEDCPSRVQRTPESDFLRCKPPPRRWCR